jgi:hypothetical protein
MPLLQDDERTTNTDWFAADCANRYAMQESDAWNPRHSLLTDRSSKWINKESSVSEEPADADIVFCAASRQDVQISFNYEDTGYALRRRAEGYRQEFEALSKTWQHDIKYSSLVSKKLIHPAFLRIVGMGEPVIPLILEALRDRPTHWFAALRATANIDPVPLNANPSEARRIWLEWGRSKGYID